MTNSERPAFDPQAFLANAGLGKRIVHLKPKQAFFSQGNVADAVFYIQEGRAKLTVVSNAGKEATITLLSPGEFVGEEAVAAVAGNRLATATAITVCTALKIDRKEMIQVIHEELLWHGFLGTRYSWHKAMPFLAAAGYAVLVPDMRGFGDSDKPAGTEGYDGRALAVMKPISRH